MTGSRFVAVGLRSTARPVGQREGVKSTIRTGQRMAGPGVDYAGPDEVVDKHCVIVIDYERCKAYKAKGTDLCAGHLRSREATEPVQD